MRKRELHAIRKRAAKAALAQRWGGDARAPSKQIRVDADAAEALAQIPDRDRRAVASQGVRDAVADYMNGGGN